MAKHLRLLSIGHSYVVGLNRLLPKALQQVGADRWQVTTAAPKYFAASRDLRPMHLKIEADEQPSVVGLNAYNTWQTHFFNYGLALRGLLQQGWDLVHCWEEPYIVSGAQIAAWTPRRTKFVFRTAQSLNKVYPPPFSWMEQYTVSRCDGWICSGKTVEANLLKRPGYAAKPRVRAPLGVSLENFKPDPAARKSIRQKLNWSDDGPPILGYFGRFVPEKGLGMLMKVLQQLKCPWRAMLVGGGPMTDYLRQWEAHFPNQLKILTDVHHDQMPAYLNSVDALVLPSQTTPRWKEQFGRIIVEAFACGVPVLGSDSGEIPNVIGESGRVIPEADPAAWVRHLEEVLGDAKLRQELAALSLERAQEFHWPAVAKQLLNFFDTLM